MCVCVCGGGGGGGGINTQRTETGGLIFTLSTLDQTNALQIRSDMIYCQCKWYRYAELLKPLVTTSAEVFFN